MKTLLILFVLTAMSFTTMGMGFPHSTLLQQRALMNKNKKVDVFQKVKQVENTIENTVKEQQTSFTESFVQKVCNFFINIIKVSFSSHKTVAINHIHCLSGEHLTALNYRENIFIG